MNLITRLASIGHTEACFKVGMSAVFKEDHHYYTNFTGGGRFRFSVAGKAVCRGLEATVNRGLTAAGGGCPPWLTDLPRRVV